MSSGIKSVTASRQGGQTSTEKQTAHVTEQALILLQSLTPVIEKQFSRSFTQYPIQAAGHTIDIKKAERVGLFYQCDGE